MNTADQPTAGGDVPGRHAAGLTDEAIARLVEAARRASEAAYCGYSNFPVGAAVLTSEGDVHSGCNVENASYGLTLCAERNAIFHAVAAGRRKLRAIAVYTPTKTPTPPCGACRQVIREFGPDAIVLCAGKDGPVRHWTLSQLLPEAFGPEDLV